MMVDDLLRPAGWVEDQLAVPRERDRGSALDDGLERLEVIAEWIGPARGPQPDRRGDRVEEVIGGEQHPVAKQRQLPVRVPGGSDDLPALEASRRARSASPRRTNRMNGVQYDPDSISSPVTSAGAPCDPNHAVSTSVQSSPLPDADALLEVDGSLRHARARELDDVAGGTHVVGVEVRDEEPA